VQRGYPHTGTAVPAPGPPDPVTGELFPELPQCRVIGVRTRLHRRVPHKRVVHSSRATLTGRRNRIGPVNPSRDLPGTGVKLVEFRGDLSEFRKKDLTLLLGQPACSPRAIAA